MIAFRWLSSALLEADDDSDDEESDEDLRDICDYDGASAPLLSNLDEDVDGTALSECLALSSSDVGVVSAASSSPHDVPQMSTCRRDVVEVRMSEEPGAESVDTIAVAQNLAESVLHDADESQAGELNVERVPSHTGDDAVEAAEFFIGDDGSSESDIDACGAGPAKSIHSDDDWWHVASVEESYSFALANTSSCSNEDASKLVFDSITGGLGSCERRPITSDVEDQVEPNDDQDASNPIAQKEVLHLRLQSDADATEYMCEASAAQPTMSCSGAAASALDVGARSEHDEHSLVSSAAPSSCTAADDSAISPCDVLSVERNADEESTFVGQSASGEQAQVPAVVRGFMKIWETVTLRGDDRCVFPLSDHGESRGYSNQQEGELPACGDCTCSLPCVVDDVSAAQGVQFDEELISGKACASETSVSKSDVSKALEPDIPSHVDGVVEEVVRNARAADETGRDLADADQPLETSYPLQTPVEVPLAVRGFVKAWQVLTFRSPEALSSPLSAHATDETQKQISEIDVDPAIRTLTSNTETVQDQDTVSASQHDASHRVDSRMICAAASVESAIDHRHVEHNPVSSSPLAENIQSETAMPCDRERLVAAPDLYECRRSQRCLSTTRRGRRVDSLLAQESVPKGILAEQIWSGVPADYQRAEAWQILLGYMPAARQRRCSVLRDRRSEYRELRCEIYEGSSCSAKSGGAGAAALQQIRCDLPRTEICRGPHADNLQAIVDSELVQALMERVLFVWSTEQPSVGYVQGMNDVLLPLLFVFLSDRIDVDLLGCGLCMAAVEALPDGVLDEVEADCYWCFTSVLDQVVDHYVPGQPGLVHATEMLKMQMGEVDGFLLDNFETQGVELKIISLRWLGCLMVRDLSLHLCVRLWDTCIAESALGQRRGFADFLVSFIVRLLASHSAKLCNSAFDELMEFCLRPPLERLDATNVDILISEAFIHGALIGKSCLVDKAENNSKASIDAEAHQSSSDDTAQASVSSQVPAAACHSVAPGRDVVDFHSEVEVAPAHASDVQHISATCAFEPTASLPHQSFVPVAERPKWTQLGSTAYTTSVSASLRSGAGSWSLCSSSLAEESYEASDAEELGKLSAVAHATAEPDSNTSGSWTLTRSLSNGLFEI